jgi:hypothetical protein
MFCSLNRSLTLLLFPLLLGHLSWAQTPAPCACPVVLAQAISKTTAIYAGFHDKVTPQSRRRYQALLDSLQRRARQAKTGYACFDLLNRYAHSFRDRHVSVDYTTHLSASTMRRLAYSEAQAQAYLSQQRVLQPYEGIWQRTDGTLRVATVPDPAAPGRYVSVVLATTLPYWQPGMVQAQVFGTSGSVGLAHYVFEDFTSRRLGLRPDGARYQVWGQQWQRVFPAPAPTPPPPAEQVIVKPLTPDVVYVRLPYFTIAQVAKLDSLLNVNRALIGRTPSLIFDMRGNGGGDSGAWGSEEFMRLFYTQPIPLPTSRFRASDEYIATQTAYVERLRKQPTPDAKEVALNQQLLDSLRAHRGGFVPNVRQHVLRYDSVRAYPQRIAVLQDKGCGSAAEYFLAMAKYSTKITRFGTYTGGFMDYGNANPFPLACADFTLYLPVTRMPWVDTAPIDNIGYAPDVPIARDEKDWVQFVLTYWAK